MGNSHTNYSMHTQYPNGLTYNERCNGSMYGNDEFHDTDASKFKHHLIRGTDNRDRIGHELTFRGSDY